VAQRRCGHAPPRRSVVCAAGGGHAFEKTAFGEVGVQQAGRRNADAAWTRRPNVLCPHQQHHFSLLHSSSTPIVSASRRRTSAPVTHLLARSRPASERKFWATTTQSTSSSKLLPHCRSRSTTAGRSPCTPAAWACLSVLGTCTHRPPDTIKRVLGLSARNCQENVGKLALLTEEQRELLRNQVRWALSWHQQHHVLARDPLQAMKPHVTRTLCTLLVGAPFHRELHSPSARPPAVLPTWLQVPGWKIALQPSGAACLQQSWTAKDEAAAQQMEERVRGVAGAEGHADGLAFSRTGLEVTAQLNTVSLGRYRKRGAGVCRVPSPSRPTRCTAPAVRLVAHLAASSIPHVKPVCGTRASLVERERGARLRRARVRSCRAGGLTENDFIVASKVNDLSFADLLPKRRQRFWA
jgi:hypothetical protein